MQLKLIRNELTQCVDGSQVYAESLQPQITIEQRAEEPSLISIPHAADTTYLAHGYFRFIGKYPPQIVAWAINNFGLSGPILDPMCGGGTTLVEARLRGIDAIGIDVNPVSREVSRVAASPFSPEELEGEIATVLSNLKTYIGAEKIDGRGDLFNPLCAEYYSEETRRHIATYLRLIRDVPDQYQEFFRVALFSIVRQISRANIKKMNLEIDDNKKKIYPFPETIVDKLNEMAVRNRDYFRWAKAATIRVAEGEASCTGLPDNSVGTVFLHPPYLTNTAFCEFTQLQLATIGVDHRSIWKRELRCRGSFLHEPNGLKKYLIGWSRIIAEATRVLRPGGHLVSVVGDGQIDYVRIPVGTITREFARDQGLQHLGSWFHVLNNHTGQTQNRKMKGQHVSVFQKGI